MKPLNAGELRHRITFQTPSDSSNALSDPATPTWTDVVGDVPAKIEPLSGRELATLRSQGGTETHRITCRYYPGLNVTMRIAYSPTNGTTITGTGEYFGKYFGDTGSNETTTASDMRYFRFTSISDIEERHVVLVIMAIENLHP